MDFQLSLQSEPVSSAYPDEPLATTSASTVGEVMQLLRAQRTGAVLICESNDGEPEKLVGIFTERDALRAMADGSDLKRPVSEVMATEVMSVERTTSVGETIKRMADGGYRHAPVLDTDGRPVGVVATAGIVHYLVDHFPETIYNLPPKPTRTQADREGA